MTATQSWAATAPESGLAPLSIDRRDLRAEDVAIDIAFCGARPDSGAVAAQVAVAVMVEGSLRYRVGAFNRAVKGRMQC